jgi:hypothetical protein
MKLFAIGVLLAAGACSDLGNDVYPGARSECAEGGTLESCPEAERTPEDACWRLVDCGVIALRNSSKDGGFDWGECVDDVEGLTADRQRSVIDCIAVSSCDSLKVDGSPDSPNTGELVCFQFGAGQ